MLITRPSYVEFVVDKGAMDYFFLLVLGFYPASTISPIPFVCHSCYINLPTDNVIQQGYPKQHTHTHTYVPSMSLVSV